MDFHSSFNNHRLSLRNQSSGILLILLACFIPIILVSIRYSEKLFERHWKILEVPDSNRVTKQCAKEAALAVARNYNPGLTLAQQKEALYKVSDYIYNHTLSSGNSVLTRAIPGIHIETKDSNSVSSIGKFVSYTTAPKYLLTLQSTKSDTSNESSFTTIYYHTLWLIADGSTDSSHHHPSFDKVDTKILPYTDCMLIHEDFFSDPSSDASSFTYKISSATPNLGSGTGYNPADILATYGVSQAFSTSSSENGTYSIRSTGSDAQCVEISIAEDAANLGKIKVQTDDDIAYAVPATCNVDVVFAIPTNSAACEYTGGNTTKSSMHQMVQACREFIKDHFFNTRGVYMSLIPYSGKLSISPDRLQDWTIAFPKYTVDPEQIFLIGACLYSTTGLKDASLSQESYNWGNAQSGYPIMFRAGVAQTTERYHNNSYFTGFLFDSSDPSTGDSYKYLRQNSNPCHVEYVDLERGLCISNCPKYQPNPYYMVEPTADITKIYEMLSALLPFSDSYNASNFIFPVFEWANNFFQGWTRDPGKNAISGGSDIETAQLGSQSKTIKNRKKAIILLVNKPDWFEPGEMTYLGLYNDYQELHTQSDTIDFSIDFSDKSKRFVDGRPYDGTIMGHKKLLQFEGTSTRDSAYYVGVRSTECVLKFPYKALIRLKVEQISADKEGSLKFTNLAISREGVAVNNDKYCVTTPMEFYVEADQLSEPEEADELYHLNFEASNVRFLQADITNRKYSKYSLTRYAKVSGTGTILGTNIVNGTKTITLRTKHELPMQVKVESVGDHASITLDGVTYNNITETMRKTFTNRGAAGYENWNEYSSSLTQDFVTCANLQNLTINAYLNNQSIYFPELISRSFSSETFEFTFPFVILNGILHLSWCNAAHSPPIVYFNGESIGSSPRVNYEFHLNSNTPAAISWNGNNAHHDEGVPGVTNLDTVPFGTNPNANCVYLENGYFKYQGRGDLTVEVTPQLSKIKHQRPDGSSAEHIYTNTTPKLITLDPNEYRFEKGDDGYYYVTLELTNVKSLTTVIMEENFFEVFDPTITEADGIAVIKTTTKRPVRLRAESRGPASITLDGVTYNNITETMRKTFTNRGAAGYKNWNEYSSSLTQDFVTCANLQNLTINAYLNNQSIYFPELISRSFSSETFEFTFPFVISNGILHLSWCNAAHSPPIVYFNGESIGSSPRVNYEFHLNLNTPAVISWNGNNAHHDEGVPGVTNLDTVPFGTNPNANCVYLENGYFKYQGRGDLTVEILIPIYIKYTHPDGTEGKIDYGKVGTHSMTVDPEQFKYEGSSPYTIKLETIGIEKLSRLRTAEKRIVFEFWDDSEAKDGAGNTVLRNYLGSNCTGNSSEDAAAATKLSVDKMRATWGANLRIYVVKYNPELSYEEDGKTKNFDYSTVNACASDGGNLYEVNNAEELKEKFEMIWEDLRNWAGYQEAKIVP